MGKVRCAIEQAKNVVEQQVSGRIVKIYDIHSHSFFWIYGDIRLPELVDAGGATFTDDPWAGKKNMPIANLPEYLEWYWAHNPASPHYKAPAP
jgi:hypothetical protein